jgi:hypothetical protein
VNDNFKRLRNGRENANNMEEIFDDGNCLMNWTNINKKVTFIIADTNVYLNHLNTIIRVYGTLCSWRTRKLINR